MHLFLDANVYLGFYKLSGDDIDELEKLAITVRAGGTVLYLPEQVRDEFRRNRGGIINDSLKHVESAAIPKAFPRLLTNLTGYSSLRETLELFERQRSDLVQEARQSALDGTLAADRLIDELFEIGHDIPITTAIWSAATSRHQRGNPPGKKDSIGDALNWESLLHEVPNEPLSLVTADKDYASKLDDTKLNEFLVDEWSERKEAPISGYLSLTSLFKEKYPDIRLAADLERELAIDSLVQSASFRDTHIAIQRLRSYPDFSAAQVQSLVEAAETNSQIRQILEDTDVNAFYSELLADHEDALPEELSDRFRQRLEAIEDDD